MSCSNNGFFEKYHKVIGGLAGIATSLALVAACITLTFTYCELKEAKQQIRAGISYNMHKDGREIFKSLDSDVVDFIRSMDPEKTYCLQFQKKAESNIHEILMYYASFYRQWEFGNVHEREWEVILAELCKFLKYPHVKEYWQKRVAKNTLWNEGFREKGNQCLTEKKEGKNAPK